MDRFAFLISLITLTLGSTLGSIALAAPVQAPRVETFTCSAQDIKVSLTREGGGGPENPAGRAIHEESVLRVTCKGRDPLLLKTGLPVAFNMSPVKSSWGREATQPLLTSTFYYDGLMDKYTVDLQKSYMAMILTAKATGLPVALSYDPKSPKNYRDGNALIGVSIE